jgi:hypothetical protein
MATTDGPNPLAGNTSTWDDWIVLRGRPEPGPGETSVTISTADAIASQIQYGLYDFLDLSMPHVRDAIRELFDEFERDTDGQVMQWRDMTTMRRELPWSQCKVEHDDARRLTLVITSDSVPHDMRMSTDQAKELAALLLKELDDLGELDPDD